VAESTDGGGIGALRLIVVLSLLGSAIYSYFIIMAVSQGNLLLFLVMILSSFFLLFATIPFAVSYYIAGICMRPPWYRPSTVEEGLPSDNCPEYWSGIINDPKIDMGLEFEDVEFNVSCDLPPSKSPKISRISSLRKFSATIAQKKNKNNNKNNYTLRGWYVPAQPLPNPLRSTPSPFGTASPHPPQEVPQHPGLCCVCVHGGGRDRRAFLRHVPLFVKRGIPCLLFDFREHGISDGSGRGFTYGVKEHMDVSAAVKFMKKKSGASTCLVLATSVGATSAIIAAAEDQNIDGIIAENPLTRPEELLTFLYSNALNYSLGPKYADWTLCKWFGRLLVAVFLTRIGALRIDSLWPDHRGAIDVVHKISPRPILVMHGDNDTIIPFSQGISVFEAAQEPKKMWLVKGGAHCQLYDHYPDEYEEKVEELIQQIKEGNGGQRGIIRRKSL